MQRKGFGTEHQLFRESVRRFLQAEAVPHLESWRRQGEVDRQIFRKAGDHGFLFMWAEEKYGGLGLNDFRYDQILIEELYRVGCGDVFIPTHNRLVGRTAGWTEEQLDALSGDGYAMSPLFSAREKAVIRWAELVNWNKAGSDDAAFADLARYFDSTEIVELTTVAAFRGLMNRFMDSLHIELEGPELQARGGRAAASVEDLHAYIGRLADLL